MHRWGECGPNLHCLWVRPALTASCYLSYCYDTCLLMKGCAFNMQTSQREREKKQLMRTLLALIAGPNGKGVTYRKIFRYSRSRSTFIAGLSGYWFMLGSAAQIKEGVGRRGSDIKSPAVAGRTLNAHTYAQGGMNTLKDGTSQNDCCHTSVAFHM